MTVISHTDSLEATTGLKKSSNNQEMWETREPMARDFWEDALKMANLYEHVGSDFWIMYAAKPHCSMRYAAVAGWQVVFSRPPAPILGVLVLHVDHKTKEMRIDTRLSMPYDVPLLESELSDKESDFVPTLCDTAKRTRSVVLA